MHHQRHGCTHAPTSSPVKTTTISLQHSRFSEREKEKRRERQRSTQREREKMFHLTHRTLFRERHVIERDSSMVVRRRGPFSSTRVNLARREHNFPACNETFACSVGGGRGPQAGLFCCDSIYFTAFRWSAPARSPAFHIRATSTVAMVANAAAIEAIRKRTLQRTECTKKQFCLPIGLSGTAETEGGNVC